MSGRFSPAAKLDLVIVLVPLRFLVAFEVAIDDRGCQKQLSN